MFLRWHEDDYVPVPEGGIDRLDLPADIGKGEIIDSYVGSPMYRIIAEHAPAVVVLLGLWLGFWWLKRRGSTRLDSYFALPLVHRFLAWLLAITGVGHLALVFTHEPSFYTGLYLLGGVAPLYVLRRLLRGERWRRWTALIMLGLIVGYGASLVSGEAPDQYGLAMKLVELTALFIVLRPTTDTRWRRFAASAASVSAALFIALVSWVGAFSSGDGGHHLGETPAPGVLLPAGEDREPTSEESVLAAHLFFDTRDALAKYEDVDVAREAGYAVDGMSGRSFHADNEQFKGDGVYFDPERPETLVYAVADSGQPVLLGAMFQMDGIGQPGPAIGGPLTVWHAHDHVCFSLTPPGLAGLTSPLGQCPLGSFTMPITHEMLHIWTLPGVEEAFGDIDDEWLNDYLSTR